MSEEDDEARRKREINMFSAMAAGSSFIDESATAKPAPTAAPPPPPVPVTETAAAKSNDDENNDDDSANSDSEKDAAAAAASAKETSLFSQAANPLGGADDMNSGTFAMASTSSSTTPARSSSNLEAAVAALTGEAPAVAAPAAPSSHMQRMIMNNNNQQNLLNSNKKAKEIPMHSEKVFLPRPLFFGPILPPRVLKETRRIVGEALQERKQSGDDLPPHVVNLIGTIEAFGFGLSPYPDASIEESDPRYYTGNANVTTYQPVWGDAARADREAEWKMKRSSQHNSPKRRTPQQSSPLRDAEDKDVPPFRAPSSRKSDRMRERAAAAAEAGGTASTKNIADDHNMFAAWANGDDGDAAIVDSSSASEKPAKKIVTDDRDMFSKWANGGGGRDDGDTAIVDSVNDSEKTATKTGTDDRDMFSKWANGGDDGDAATAKVALGSAKSASETAKNVIDDRDMFSKWAQGGGGDDDDGPVVDKTASTTSEKNTNKPATDDRDMFSKWANGDDDAGVKDSPSATKTDKPTTNNAADDRNMFSKWAQGGEDDDDGPVVDTASMDNKTPKNSNVNVNDDRNMFSAWAQGGEKSSSPVGSVSSVHSNEPPKSTTVSPPSAIQNKSLSPFNEKNLFSQLARGDIVPSDDDSAGSLTNTKNNSNSPVVSPSAEKDMFLKWARSGGGGGSGSDDDDEDSLDATTASNTSVATSATSSNNNAPSEEQTLFSKWALGGGNDSATAAMNASTSSIKPNGSMVVTSSAAAAAGGTFCNVAPPPVTAEDSDDDSVVGSEMKKKVGMNEHLNAALASLANDQMSPQQRQSNLAMGASVSISAEESQALLAQLGQTTPGGRPLTNLEITSGCVPHFGCDDPSLPVESDLGIYETKEDQIRSLESKRAQEFVEKHTMPDVFGPVACPNPATGPDDNHSSNLRTIPARKPTALSINTGALSRELLPNGGGGNDTPGGSSRKSAPPVSMLSNKQGSGTSDNVHLPPTLKKTTSAPMSQRVEAPTGKPPRSTSNRSLAANRYGTTTRFGWWNILEEEDVEKVPKTLTDVVQENSDQPDLLKIRSNRIADQLLVSTRLKPSPAKLREDNAPLSHLHSATSVASSLPFLSDRPPSWRYLQIDTKAIGFTALGGEIEPLFCSLAIYHVETISSTGSDHSSVPAPNLQKCGRVTEVLHFDVVSDNDVERRCYGSLWPYHADKENLNTLRMDDSEKTQGTRCGVFPIPSNLNIANLYAILVVQKVLADKSDVDVYAKPDHDAKGSHSRVFDREKCREHAEKASDRQGRFLMPVAFGVTPLLQVFGTDTPTNPTSRAVQIPLFQFTSGLGERQIIDHIMVMLYPRAYQKNTGVSAPAPNTNGGTAMLVMRYFGYLGLHSVVHNKSSLARHRLVDFTGELQIRRKGEDEKSSLPLASSEARSARDYCADPWGVKYTSEPTALSGRNVVPMKNKDYLGNEKLNEKLKFPDTAIGLRTSTLYAQELAAIPLQVSPSVGRSATTPMRINRGRFGTQSSGSEPYFHTSFCNELLCNPRLVHNCPKGNIVTKVELRELEWNEELNSHIASLPKSGPHLHNQRRGAPFVDEAFTSCSLSSTSVTFLSEFKAKLPLLLSDPKNQTGQLVLLFSVYHVETRPKKSWTERGAKVLSKQFGVGSPDPHPTKKKATLELLGCGFLPIVYNVETSCLIDNGFHDVKLCYDAKPASPELPGHRNALHLTRKEEASQSVARDSESPTSGIEDDSISGSIDERVVVDTDEMMDEVAGSVRSRTSRHSRGNSFGTGSIPISDTTSDRPFRLSASAMDQMSLQVRIIVHSSIHPQNATLREFLQQRPSPPLPLSISKLPPGSPWKFGRDDLLFYIRDETKRTARQRPSEQTEKVLAAAVDVCKSSLCSNASLSNHSIRVVEELLTIICCGNGEPSLQWANPALVVPLRIHAFATLLQLLHSVSNHLGKHGLKQLDGKSKWNMTALGRALSLLFDERKLFSRDGDYPVEPVDVDAWKAKVAEKKLDRPKLVQRKSSGGRRRHVRSDSDSLMFASEMLGEKSPTRAPQTMSFDGGGSLADDLANFTSTAMTLPANITAALNKPAQTPVSKDPIPDSALDWSDQKVDTSASFDSPFGVSVAQSVEVQDPLQQIANSGFGGLTGRRRFMTLPSSALATIREDNDHGGDEELRPVGLTRSTSIENSKFKKFGAAAPSSPLDVELIKKEKKTKVKQMRVPKVNRGGASMPQSIPLNVASVATAEVPEPIRKEKTLSDDHIESAGGAFLDEIGKSFGYAPAKVKSGEEQRVGQAHHRKTRSRCSIDWTIPEDDSFLQRQKAVIAQSPLASPPRGRGSDDIGSPGSQDEHDMSASLGLEATLLKPESANAKNFPSYLDRIVLLGKKNQENGRWFPYVFEVLIFQWVAILTEQKRSGDKRPPSDERKKGANDYVFGWSDDVAPLREAALRARGCAVACAPVLLELIKKSLGTRLHDLVRQADNSVPSLSNTPPLIRLDGAILGNLENLISMVTDACIDSRNFDSREFQQISIDVNDAIVRFLRDLFAFLDAECVHRLILVYFSRFVVKDGKHWQDRDSKIGLRCSWEICKLRLNAITAFIRFPDFVRVNSPQMANWGSWPTTSLADITMPFFDKSLESFLSLEMSGFVATDGSKQQSGMVFPKLRPHWLAELVVDICLSGTEHAEQKIQHRASSLLHELFWAHSVEGKVGGSSSMVASMYVPFLLKMLHHTSYLSSLGAKTQLRKDLMPCIVFVLQCTPIGLLRSSWRKLCIAAKGKGATDKFGSVPHTMDDRNGTTNASFDTSVEPNILDMFSLLNLALSTFEYEGGEDTLDLEDRQEDDDRVTVWSKEYLPAIKPLTHSAALLKRSPLARRYQLEKKELVKDTKPTYSSTSSRKWHSHDGSLVIINSCRYVVREMMTMLKPGKQASTNKGNGLNSSFSDQAPMSFNSVPEDSFGLNLSNADTVVFVRGASSVYLHSLTIRGSDIVMTKTLTASIELVKIFGIKVFLEAVGETLQHWMRVVMMHCGARRANVRVQSLEFLALILRVTWDSFGSFFRIRLPLLAVQTEVMERIVALATTRYYREQRKLMASIHYLTNDCAEASVSLFWRTLDRLHHQSASQNVAFRTALIRLAQKMKKLYRAYIAAHALSILKRARSPLSPGNNSSNGEEESFEAAALNQSRRISVHRIVNASAGYCKQFLGVHRPTVQKETLAHNEAVEDAFLDAADVFSSTELPSHRVAWLQKLAEFHNDRMKYAEEATCHFQMQLTFRQAARLHEIIWSSVPFLPWTDSGVHVDGEGPAGEPDEYYDADDFDDFLDDQGVVDAQYGRQIDKTNTFRRIFYRVANSVRMRTGDWEISGNKHLFYGVTLVSEFSAATPWMSLREMEERMIEAAEASGELYLKAGIAESSRVAWGLATSYYALRYNYAKLAHAYRRLSTVVASQVPVVDTNELALDFSHPIGRFYRVWFHGGAPDDLLGAEFVYRAPSSVKLHSFGKKLSEVIRTILPENTPIDLVLDDGKPEESNNWRSAPRRALGPAPLEPVKIKVTPLRPLLRRAHQLRGSPEWFDGYTESEFSESGSSPQSRLNAKDIRPVETRQYRAHHRDGKHSRSFSASVFGSSGSVGGRGSDGSSRPTDVSRQDMGASADGGDLVGVDKFSFLQPIKRDRNRASRDWLKSSGDFSEKSLRVTQLQVKRSFPACVARQAVVQRSVFKQSPLEAGVDAVCTWCAVLFRTAVVTNGMRVLGRPTEHGIGNAAAKVVADCIHSSRVKEMGLTLLKKQGYVAEETDADYGASVFDYAKLSEDEVRRLQIKLGRGIVVFIEMLHLLISRNRDQLLAVVEARKESFGGTYAQSATSRVSSAKDWSPSGRRGFTPSAQPSHSRGSSTLSASIPSKHVSSNSLPIQLSHLEEHTRRRTYSNASFGSLVTSNDRTDLAIAVQSELQRAFISMCKAMYPNLSRILGSETPRWLKQCSLDNYFSSYTYRQTSIPMADEVCFFSGDDFDPDSDNDSFQMTGSFVSSADPGLTGLMNNESQDGSAMDVSVASRGSTPMHYPSSGRHMKAQSSDSISFQQV